MSDTSFLGTGWTFPLKFHSRGVSLSHGETDIAESLRILISTQPGERTMNPHFGCDLHEFTFKPINASTISQLKDRIARSILFYEPRVAVETIEVIEQNETSGALRIEIIYVVHSTNTRHNLVFPYYLTEATEAIV